MQKPINLIFSIEEASNLVGVSETLLLEWEKYFPQLDHLRKSKKRQYNGKAIKILRAIRYLVYEKKLSIKEVQKALNNNLEELLERPIASYSISFAESGLNNFQEENYEKDLYMQPYSDVALGGSKIIADQDSVFLLEKTLVDLMDCKRLLDSAK